MEFKNNNSLFVGKVAMHLTEVDSTNTFAKELLAKSNPSEGTAIYADYQRAGKGQIGSRWQSAPGENLLLSLILYPRFLPADRLFVLNQAVSLAVCEALAPCLPPDCRLCVKWPNDIYIDDEKVAGILIENQIKGFFTAYSIVGIGINVRQTRFDPDLPNPTSLALKNPQKKIAPAELLSQLFSAVERHYLALRAERYEELRQNYLHRLYRLGQAANFRDNVTSKIIHAKIIDVNHAGNLVLKCSDSQKIHTFAFKELSFL